MTRCSLSMFRFVAVTATCLTLLLVFESRGSALGDRGRAGELEDAARQLAREWNGDSVHRSISLFEKASSAWQAAGRFREASICLRESARLAALVSDYQRAQKNFALALRIGSFINDLDGNALTLSFLSRLAGQRGEVKKSEYYYKRAHDLGKRSPSPVVKANALLAAAEYIYAYGTIDEAIELYEQAVVESRRSGDVDLTADSLVGLSYASARRDDPSIGFPKVEEAVTLYRQVGNKRGEAIATVALGFLYILTGEYQKALEYYGRAEGMFPEDADWLEKAKLYNGVAAAYDVYGEPDLSLGPRVQALELYRKASYPAGVLTTLVSLARLYYFKGEFEISKNQFQEALQIAIRTDDRFHLAVIRENSGDLYYASGDFKRAIESYKEAQSVYHTLGTVLPRIENNLGKAFEQQGESDKAEEYYKSALEKNRTVRDLAAQAENLFNLGRLAKTKGNLEEALACVKESIKITDSVYYNTANDNLKTGFLSNVFDRWELYISVLMQLSHDRTGEDRTRQALQVAERSRARLTVENLSRMRAGAIGDADPQLVKEQNDIISSLNIKADELTDLLTKDRGSPVADEMERQIHQLEVKLDDIRSKLRNKSPVFSAISDPKDFDVGEFQNAVLDDQTVCLEFFLGASESYLWLVSKNQIRSYILPPRKIIDDRIDSLRELLTSREIEDGETIENYQARLQGQQMRYEQESLALSRELFGTIDADLDGKRLIIIPDGKLNYFPVSALSLQTNSNAEPAIDTNEVVYAPSAATLLLSTEMPRRSESVADLLVFSDPVYSRDDPRISNPKHTKLNRTDDNDPGHYRFAKTLDDLHRLPASMDEAESIVGIVGNSRTTLLAGFDANRDRAVSPELSKYRVIHFATHGLVNDDHPELSGLVLSRFNDDGEPINEFIRLHDIYTMSLASDLVVLSACNTGIGRQVRGEGLLSLNSAFLQSGAKTVVSSLWKVDDTAAKELMKSFYTNMAELNLPVPESLRRAQIELRKNPKYASPFFWGSFIAEGDFRASPSFSNRRPVWVYITTAVLTVFVVSILFWCALRRLLNRKTVT